jgi:hypothetical protein
MTYDLLCTQKWICSSISFQCRTSSTLVSSLIYEYIISPYVAIRLLQEEYCVIICHHDAAKHTRKSYDTTAHLFLIIKDGWPKYVKCITQFWSSLQSNLSRSTLQLESVYRREGCWIKRTAPERQSQRQTNVTKFIFQIRVFQGGGNSYGSLLSYTKV